MPRRKILLRKIAGGSREPFNEGTIISSTVPNISPPRSPAVPGVHITGVVVKERPNSNSLWLENGEEFKNAEPPNKTTLSMGDHENKNTSGLRAPKAPLNLPRKTPNHSVYVKNQHKTFGSRQRLHDETNGTSSAQSTGRSNHPRNNSLENFERDNQKLLQKIYKERKIRKLIPMEEIFAT